MNSACIVLRRVAQFCSKKCPTVENDREKFSPLFARLLSRLQTVLSAPNPKSFRRLAAFVGRLVQSEHSGGRMVLINKFSQLPRTCIQQALAARSGPNRGH